MNDLKEKDADVQLSPELTVVGGILEKPSLQEYVFWAEKKRAREAEDTGYVASAGLSKVFGKYFRSTPEAAEVNEKDQASTENAYDSTDDLVGLTERQIELANARRVLRQAGWATVFYLITCDILGPFNAPYAIAQQGLVPGVILYVVFGGAAMLTGFMLCRLFCRLDSVRFPVKTYGDLAERVIGVWARHACSILQSIQLIINVGIICLSNGQSLAQITNGKLCFTICIVIWAFLGMVVGQIRSLNNFSILANSSVWLNLLLIFLSMGVIAHSPPNFDAAVATYGADIASGPITVAGFLAAQPLFASVNGLFNCVFAWGGAMIFPEILAEMRRPRDFIKGMAMAQGLIFVCYLMYGVFVYSFQGQYTLPLAYQGISDYTWQTVGNVIALITGSIAAGLYGNIGIKIVYTTIIEDLLNGPPMMSPRGRWLWSFLVIGYWGLAFVIGTAIPSIGALSGLVAAVAIFQFTYTFPPLLMLAYDVGWDASRADEQFSTPGVTPKQIDTWSSASRWKRGFLDGGSKRVALKFANLFFFLACCATAGLGMWATGTDLKESLAAGSASSFGCLSPTG